MSRHAGGAVGYTLRKPCLTCDGTGTIAGPKVGQEIPCPDCKGKGWEWAPRKGER